MGVPQMGTLLHSDDKMAWGEYPAEYNPKVHGPYDPSRFYGKADTALAEVKLSELPAWLKRRNMGASGISGAISRAFWRWQYKYMQPKKVGIAPFAQVCVGAMVFFYTINYSKRAPHQLQIPLVNVRSTWTLQATV